MKTGKVNQVAAFGKLMGICNDLGVIYNPSRVSISLPALTTLLQQAQQSVEAVNVARTNFILAVNARRDSYAGIPRLASRIVRALMATDESEENIRDARMIKRRLLPTRKTVKAELPSMGQEGSSLEATPHISSRLDYDGRADTFANLIAIVQVLPAYNPHETDLQVTTLKTILIELKTRTHNIVKAQNALASARIACNKIFYGRGGIYETGTAVKNYIRSIFGMNSEPSRELAKIVLKSFPSVMKQDMVRAPAEMPKVFSFLVRDYNGSWSRPLLKPVILNEGWVHARAGEGSRFLQRS